MSGARAADRRDTRDLFWLWSAFFAAPLAWTFNQGTGYALMKPVCAAGAGYTLTLIALAALGVAASGAVVATRFLHPRRPTVHAPPDSDRSYFVAVLALAFNALIGLLIVDSAIVQLFLSPCD